MVDLEILRRGNVKGERKGMDAILTRKLYAYPEIGDANLEVYIMDF